MNAYHNQRMRMFQVYRYFTEESNDDLELLTLK